MNLLAEALSTPEKTRLFAPTHNINTFIFDLDGTLLNGKHELSDITISALHALRARNANLVIATGRHINDIRCYLQQLGGDIAAITCNGANIHDRNGELIYSEGLPQTVNNALIPLGHSFNVHTNIYTDEEWLVSAPCQSLLVSHQKARFFYRQIDHLGMLSAPALKILFYGENQALQALKEHIHIDQSAQLNITFSDENYLEVMQKNVSKGHALKILLEKLSLPLNNTMAFGDGLNDVELFNAVAHPIVMENGSALLQQLFPQAHRAQKNITDGVARFLYDHIL